ncbi:MAG TPA: hypothetical protein VER78_04020, partial [Thermoanaerobaculia bacterium]|nr:hypothetical protein [Thermoanaerobaculia bacterium]
MAEEKLDPEAREALEELEQYLSDILPPLVVADSVKVLLKYPPELTASAIHSWTVSQLRAGTDILVSDYLSYAARKVNLMGVFRLVAAEPFEVFMGALKALLLAHCPAQERAALEESLSVLGEASPALASSVDALIRGRSLAAAGVSSAPAGRSLSAEETREVRRLSFLLGRLRQEIRDGKKGPEKSAVDLTAQALAAAARGARNAKEFNQYLGRLRDLGVQMDAQGIFRALGSSLPGWVPPEPPREAGGAPATKPPGDSGTLEAMRRIVLQPEDPAEVAQRFLQMVKAAVEHFNEGGLAQAVQIFELANRMANEKKIDPGMVEVIRGKADEFLDAERLRRYAEEPRQYPLLRRVLIFFADLSPKGLLAELLRELKRERRRLLLLLLEVHGASAREAALERLQPAFGLAAGDEKWYFRRNLLYLLRRIPSPPNAPADEDVDIAVRHAVLKFPAPLVKEAIANLAQLKHEKAEKTLITLLEDLERMLLAPQESAYDPRETRLLVDRAVAALARFGTSTARRAVVDHAFRNKAGLGDTFSRLSELAGQDMSGDPELVERLLAAFKAHAPRRLLGIVLHSKDQKLKPVIEALSTTPAPAVRKALQGLLERFPDLEVSRAASRALASLEAKPPVPEALYDTRSGELDPFGLPSLVQDFSESGVTGSLALKDTAGVVFATLRFKQG